MFFASLFFSVIGRVGRGDFWYAVLLVWSAFIVAIVGLDTLVGRTASWPLYVPLFWSLWVLSVKRFHDIGRSGWWLTLLLIPVLGPLWVGWSLFFRKGGSSENRYGAATGLENLDYLVVGDSSKPADTRINDITGMNPVDVSKTTRPRSVAEVQQAIRESTGPISIGGGRFSMGGQIANPGSMHLDLRDLNRVLEFSPVERRIRVDAGIRWCDLLKFLEPHDLTVQIMQTYANFTVGGTLNVNSHGRYVGRGPVILSVRSIVLVLADGQAVHASPETNSEIFYGAIGGYGGLGVVVEAELNVAPNTRVALKTRKIRVSKYVAHFRAEVRENKKAVFHNADLYPPRCEQLLSQTWEETDKPVTQTSRLMSLRTDFPLERYFFWAVSETPYGKWRREFLIDPLVFFRPKVHWRSYEAGYDVAALEPTSRLKKNYLLQEYFVPVDRFEAFVPLIAEILVRHNVNVVNISVRHALADPGSLLAWAREEVFAFVLYYKQGMTEPDRDRVEVWTRELIDAALSQGGTYYLPYQIHGTPEQFRRAYPRAEEFFALKRKLDPAFRFVNALWAKYHVPEPAPAPSLPAPETVPTNGPRGDGIPRPDPGVSEFREIFAKTSGSDKMFLFLQNVYRLYPEEQFHWLIKKICPLLESDREIYERLQADLPAIKPLLSPLTHALPSLKKQKAEMAEQTLHLLGKRRSFDGYLEIGSTGRYISELRKEVEVTGPMYVVNDLAPTNSPVDILERGQLAKLGTYVPLDYLPLDGKGVPAASMDFVSCFIGLHHCPLERLDEFVRSIHTVLRPGGVFIIRDHDVPTNEMATFVSLVHAVFNAGLGLPWSGNEQEYRYFRSLAFLSKYLRERGFREEGDRLLQAHDPTANTLMRFVKTG